MPDSLDQLRRLLDQGDPLSYAEITERLDITVRQARRLILRLREGDVPVQEERKGLIKHFYLKEKDRREADVPLHLTPEEALALSVAAGAARAMLSSTPLRDPLERAFSRLVDTLAPSIDWVDLSEQKDRWYFGAVASNKIDSAVFQTLLQGLERGRSVRIDYRKPRQDLDAGRKIDPHCFAVIGNAVMVAAYCHRSQAMRDFSLTRIEGALLCDPATDTRPYFDRQPAFDPQTYYADDRFGAMAGGEVQVFRMLVEPNCAPFFYERDYHHSQDIVAEHDDGRIEVAFWTVGFEEVRSFVQSWGVGVTVQEPSELVERLREEAEVLARRYSSGTA